METMKEAALEARFVVRERDGKFEVRDRALGLYVGEAHDTHEAAQTNANYRARVARMLRVN